MDVGKAPVRGFVFSSGLKAALLSILLIASVISSAGLVPAYAITDPGAKMNVWSPHLESGNDGTPTSTFTFSADATASAGLDRLEWDFDGNGSVDATTPASGSTAKATHVYGREPLPRRSGRLTVSVRHRPGRRLEQDRAQSSLTSPVPLRQRRIATARL